MHQPQDQIESGPGLAGASLDSDLLLADLDSEVTLEAVTATPNSTQLSELSELDALLADSMQAVAERNEVKAARKRLTTGGYSKAQADLDAQLVQAWADRYEWQAVATVGVFNRWRCACGQQTVTFDCKMVEELHRSDKHLKRYVNPATERRAEPRAMPLTVRTIIREHEVAACGVCAEWRGWKLEGAEKWPS